MAPLTRCPGQEITRRPTAEVLSSLNLRSNLRTSEGTAQVDPRDLEEHLQDLENPDNAAGGTETANVRKLRWQVRRLEVQVHQLEVQIRHLQQQINSRDEAVGLWDLSHLDPEIPLSPTIGWTPESGWPSPTNYLFTSLPEANEQLPPHTPLREYNSDSISAMSLNDGSPRPRSSPSEASEHNPGPKTRTRPPRRLTRRELLLQNPPNEESSRSQAHQNHVPRSRDREPQPQHVVFAQAMNGMDIEVPALNPWSDRSMELDDGGTPN